MEARTSDGNLTQMLWESLEGTKVDVARVQAGLGPDARFRDLGLDSLDLVDFFLRVQDHYKVAISQEDYATLNSMGAVETFLAGKRG